MTVQRQLLGGLIDGDEWKIALAMERMLGDDGQLDPTYETIAAESGVPLRTMARKLQHLRQVGLLNWQRRLVTEDGHTRQTSNAYELLTPTEPIGAPSRPAPRPNAKLALDHSKFFIPTVDGRHQEALRALELVRQGRERAIWTAR
jgi:hypothetical protein